MKTNHCGICGAALPGGHLSKKNRPHLESVHPEYLRWYRQWGRRVFIVDAALIPLLVLGNYYALTSGNVPLLIAVNSIYIFSVSVMVAKLPLKFRKFKRQWGEDHGMAVRA